MQYADVAYCGPTVCNTLYYALPICLSQYLGLLCLKKPTYGGNRHIYCLSSSSIVHLSIYCHIFFIGFTQSIIIKKLNR